MIKVDVKSSLIADDMTLSVENLLDSKKKAIRRNF
jgi:hypothetical protein